MESRYYRDTEFLKKFGIKLRELRQRQGFTQDELANQCNLPPSQIGRMERGEVNASISHVVLIARTLGIHPKELWEIN